MSGTVGWEELELDGEVLGLEFKIFAKMFTKTKTFSRKCFGKFAKFRSIFAFRENPKTHFFSSLAGTVVGGARTGWWEVLGLDGGRCWDWLVGGAGTGQGHVGGRNEGNGYSGC